MLENWDSRRKLQIFVSSTYKDLISERQAAVEAIISSGNIPAGMELFNPGNESQLEVIKRWISESDIYILILGGRYGSIESKSGKSYTQLEYEYAQEIKLPFFSIVLCDKALDKKTIEMGHNSFEMENLDRYRSFKKDVLSKVCSFVDDCKDIKIAIHSTLLEFQRRYDLVGWIPADRKSQHSINEKKAKKTFLFKSIPDYKTFIHSIYNFDDCRNIIDELRAKKTIVINIMETDKEIAKRVVDFISGAVYFCEGSINKISDGVFMISPNESDISIYKGVD